MTGAAGVMSKAGDAAHKLFASDYGGQLDLDGALILSGASVEIGAFAGAASNTRPITLGLRAMHHVDSRVRAPAAVCYIQIQLIHCVNLRAGCCWAARSAGAQTPGV